MGKSLIGPSGTVPIAAFVPVMMFAVLFGMISVFLSFVPHPDPTVKMIGLGWPLPCSSTRPSSA